MSHEALVAALVEAQGEDARAALLSEHRELLTEKLLQELNDQGRKAAGADDYGLALKHFAAMLTAARMFGDPVWVSDALNNIGESLNALGERARALEHVRRALGMHEATGDRPGILVSLVVLANINLSLGDFAQARDEAQHRLSAHVFRVLFELTVRGVVKRDV